MTTILRVGGGGPFSTASLRKQISQLNKDLRERDLVPRTRKRAQAILATLHEELKRRSVPILKGRRLRTKSASKVA